MSATLQQPITEVTPSILRDLDVPEAIHLDLFVTDPASVRELTIRQAGRDRRQNAERSRAERTAADTAC